MKLLKVGYKVIDYSIIKELYYYVTKEYFLREPKLFESLKIKNGGDKKNATYVEVIKARWIELVARKTWIRGRSAPRRASHARSMSASLQRARPQTMAPRMVAAISRTLAKSPGEAIGKPASMTSTPNCWSAWAISIFSVRFMLAPGDCSPSRRVVSKMRIIRVDVMKEPRGAPVGGSLGAAGIGGASETGAAAVGVVGVSGPQERRARYFGE